jgi:isoleucyl-tRNA synthetase
VSMSKNNLRDQVAAAVDGVQWVPDWGKARIDSMLASSPDWCISRQRTWGVPIALFVHKETQDLHPETPRLIEAVAQKVEQGGMDAWFELDAKELLGADADTYQKVTDTLDVWFDSGVTHYAVLAQRAGLRFPADLYLEGSDQHRGWFQSSLKTSMAMHAVPPYKTVLTHGFTVDANGNKMSKSLGNVVPPQKVMNEYGADVLRLWIAATDFSNDMRVSDEILKRTADSYRRIRNTARFMLSNLVGFNPETDLVPMDQMVQLDRWIVGQTAQLQQEIIGYYNSYELHMIYQKLHNFCVVELGGFYLDIIKDRQYTVKADARARRSAQTALYYVIEALVRWIAPILSFTADEIWQVLPGKRDANVFVAEWFNLPTLPTDSFADNYWALIAEVKTAVNKVIEAKRAAGEVGGALGTEVTLFVDDKLLAELQKLGDELRFVLITSTANVQALSAAQNAEATDMSGLQVAVKKSEYTKCERCWHHRADVGANAAHATICLRCVTNVEGAGEGRAFA